MAASFRSDPGDRLIDAVIGWENLYASGQGESTFRISGALAWLLEPDASAREALQK